MVKITNAGFEDYLKDKHAEQYTGLDDDMADNFETWLSTLSIDEIIRLADNWWAESNDNNSKGNGK